MELKGLGIALVAAQKAGVPVTLVDTSQASIDKGLKFAGRITSLYSFTTD
jgi:3-hydroxybutyryl-CoA dehydrogenase